MPADPHDPGGAVGDLQRERVIGDRVGAGAAAYSRADGRGGMLAAINPVCYPESRRHHAATGKRERYRAARAQGWHSRSRHPYERTSWLPPCEIFMKFLSIWDSSTVAHGKPLICLAIAASDASD